MAMDEPALIEVHALKKHFPVKGSGWGSKRQYVRALDGVDLRLISGETLGVVGESGSGKSTLGRTIVRLETETAGEIRFEGESLASLRGERFRAFRQAVQMVFQDPYSSLNPRMTVGEALAEPLRTHGLARGAGDARDQVAELLRRVGLQPEMASAHPHAFSGGQRQRIGIARALGLRPRVLICDEAVSALDVSVQAQILNLFNQLKRELSLTYLFISHDLSVIRYIADRVAVMYLGQIVELAPAASLFAEPLHPYSRALIAARPSRRAERAGPRTVLTGEIPSPINPPAGCRFHTRCPDALPQCREQVPELVKISEQRWARCIRVTPLPATRSGSAAPSESAPLASIPTGGRAIAMERPC
jgi:oligopeptide/dipeptide ABC transporter ATP-binding protein